jgi:hypothetical protein
VAELLQLSYKLQGMIVARQQVLKVLVFFQKKRPFRGLGLKVPVFSKDIQELEHFTFLDRSIDPRRFDAFWGRLLKYNISSEPSGAHSNKNTGT